MTLSKRLSCGLAVALALACVAGGSAATKSSQRSMMLDGESRTYLVYHPASAGPNAPLVVLLHGGFGTGAQIEEHTHWDAKAEAGGFVAAFPDGYKNGWNWGGCCGNGQSPGERDTIDDVKFLTLVVQDIEKTDNVDPKRVFFAGISAGANMSFRMACQAPFPIAGIGAVAGTVDTGCSTPQKLSVLSINGTADTQIPIDGGRSTGPYVRDILPSIPSVLDKWRTLDGCSPSTSTVKAPVTMTFNACPDGRAIEWIVIDGAGHQWPGADQPSAEALARIRAAGSNLALPSSAINATDTIWQFFSNKATP
jgi:polyhydroxybutyrate depolymerase